MAGEERGRGGGPAKILLVVGHKAHAMRLRPVLEVDGYSIETVVSLTPPLPQLETSPDLAIIWFPYASPDALSGLESIIRAIHDLRAEEPMPVLLIVDQDGARWVEPSFRLKIADILMRPIHPLILRQRVRLLLKARRTERLIDELKRQVEYQERQRMIMALDSALQMFQEDGFPVGANPAHASQANTPITISQDLVFDPEEHCLIFRDRHSTAFRKARLTACQASILSYMVCHPYRTIGNRELARAALGYANLDECQAQSIVRLHILRLRRKLELDAHHPQILRTVRGSGYIFSPE
jgi:DNA-binding response OmpR family regulator